MHRSLPLAIAAVLLVGCQTDTSRQDVAGPGLERVQPVSIVEQVLGDDPALDTAAVRLIDSQQQLDDLGVTRLNQLNINFARHQLVIASLGEQPTGGYWAHIDAVQRVGDVLYVEGRANRPGPDDAVTQAITHPFAAAVIERTGARTLRSDVDSVQGRPHPAQADVNDDD